MTHNTHRSGLAGTLEDCADDEIPKPPPVPPNLAEAIATLMNATAENARFMRELVQNNQNQLGNRGRGQNNETTYVDFTETRPPVFSKAKEPLEADDWMRTIEQKFSLLNCTDHQKPQFAAQQLRGPVGAWWANFLAAQADGHQVTWQEFDTSFRAHFIPDSVMAMKLEEFLSLKQGNDSVVQFVGKFNHLAQYAADHVNTDHKKKGCFIRGLNSKMQTMMTTCPNVTYHEAVNIAMAWEEKNRQHKEAKKKKQFPGASRGIKKRL